MKKKITKEEIGKRLLSYKGIEIKDNLHCSSVITVFYANYRDVFVFDADGLSDDAKIQLVNLLIEEIQKGTNYTREIIKRYSNVFFVY